MQLIVMQIINFTVKVIRRESEFVKYIYNLR